VSLQVIYKSFDTDFSPQQRRDVRPDEVHVWSVDLESAQVLTTAGILSDDEVCRSHRFRFAHHRNRFVANRSALRMVLASYLGNNPARLHFRYSSLGKPELVLLGNSIQFSVSHSAEVTLFAIARGRRVGVDVEHIRGDVEADALAQGFFSDAEKRDIANFHGEAKLEAFFHCWTSKEALLKAMGAGFSVGLDQFDVSVDLERPPQVVATRSDPDERLRGELQRLRISPTFAAILACEQV
jgi:4'-phosphopantetheinyl transferase